MTDPTADLPPDTPSAPRHALATRGPGSVLATSLAVLFAIVAAVLAVLLAQKDSTDELDDLREAAGRFGEVLVTYDYHDPDAHKDAVLALASGSFRQDYEDAFDKGLGQIITQVQAVSKGTVNDVYVSSVDDDQAQAVVSLDIEVTGTSGPRTIDDQYVLLTLIHLEDGWKVDQVIDLSFPTTGTGGSPVTPDTTTTSAAPAPTSVP